MSYRTIKRLLGETGLEVKCRLLFGTGLLVLITSSFYSYSQLNMSVVHQQQQERAKLLIDQSMLGVHWKKTADPEADETIGAFREDLLTEEQDAAWKFIPVDYNDQTLYSAAQRPSDQAETDAVREILVGGAEFVVRRGKSDDGIDVYEYYEPISVGQSCVTCHTDDAAQGGLPPYAHDGKYGVAKIRLKAAEDDLQKNNAILWTMAIVTAVLAMIAAAAIVRYVIVKPVLHLNQVSEAIAHGELDQRADIRTGDEFEELSHAFNRMLRHLLTLQDELRQVNSNLDAKVDELAQANLSLHEMNKIKSEFLATMSHELRTPLNSILGFSDVLAAAANLDERQRKYLENINSSGHHLLALINDILDLAKIEAGKMEVHVTEVVLDDLVERVCAGMLPLAEKKNIDLQWDVASTAPLLRQDVGKLQQILNNLVSNAVKFTPDGGRIRITAAPVGGGQVKLVVADTGIGIPLEDQSRVFEKFRQGRAVVERQDALTREYEGTGLGLSIVKELCRLLSGEVTLESEFGKGSTFTVTFPVALDQAEPDRRVLAMSRAAS